VLNCRLRVCLVLMVLGCGLAAPAYAQSFGVKAGASGDPDQFFVGGHLESPGLTQTGHLTFRPNGEIGFGNGTTSVDGNFEFVYWVKFPNSQWSGYLGAGPAVDWIHTDFASRAHGGFNGVIGFQNDGGVFFELRAGGGAGPNGFQAAVGYVFKKP
jgi:hypothetical protein